MGINMSSSSNWHSSAERISIKKKTGGQLWGKNKNPKINHIWFTELLFANKSGVFTCTKLISSNTKGLNLQLEGVDGQSLGHIESLLLTAHVRVPQGASQVVQAYIMGQEGLCSKGENRG